jgi:opacity protein-like surface antigen
LNRAISGYGDVLSGWFAGGGTLWALNDTVSFGIEYRHVDWGDITQHVGTDGVVFPGRTRLELTGDQVVFKFNVSIGHFNPFR